MKRAAVLLWRLACAVSSHRRRTLRFQVLFFLQQSHYLTILICISVLIAALKSILHFRSKPLLSLLMQRPAYSIVQVTDQLNVGGAEQMIVMLANLLQSHGHPSAVVTTVAPGLLAKKLHNSVQLINLKRSWKWNPATLYRLIKVLRRFDVVHVHAAYNLRYVYLASRLFFLCKPIFYHEHYGNAVNTSPSFLQRHIYAQTVFVAVSQKLAEWAIEKVGLPRQKVFVLSNTVIKNNAEAAYVSNETLQLCITGNILPNKNILFALRLLQALQQRQQPAYLTIIGGIADAHYYKQLLNFIQAHNLQQSVAFITNCTDVQNVLHQFTAAIHCALSESGPLVLIEYLAQGLPFITYNTGEVVQQLQSHLPAFIMHDFDVEKWLRNIEYIITLPKRQTTAQLNNLYQTLFSPEAYYQHCIEIYKQGLQHTP